MIEHAAPESFQINSNIISISEYQNKFNIYAHRISIY